MANHHGERQLPLGALDQERNGEDSSFDDSSNELLVEDAALRSYPPTKSNYEIFVLTISLTGLQSAYCSQFADGTDFLLDIGISPTVIASVWIIPPLCGATLQLTFGILSDRLKEKGGRREPLVLLGSTGLLFALLTQAWTSTVADSLDDSCKGTSPACRTKIFVSIFAVVMLYTSAQAVQVGTRSNMVDECPATQQLDANTWASRVISLTSALYYILSYGLPQLSTIELRMQELALISSIIIIGATSIYCVAGYQRPPPYPTSQVFPSKNTPRHMSYIQQLNETVNTRITKILAVQFLASLAWFPYLFYISRYITEKGHRKGNTADRLGPLALFLQSVVQLTTSLILPLLVRRNTRNTNSGNMTFDTPRIEPLRIWRLSLALYSVFVGGILLTTSTALMLALAAMIGFCWAVAQIIPYTMLTDEFIRSDHGDQRRSSRAGLFLGINSLSMTIPQIIAGVICTRIFSMASEKDSNSLSNGMTRSLAAGSLVSLLATIVSFCI